MNYFGKLVRIILTSGILILFLSTEINAKAAPSLETTINNTVLTPVETGYAPANQKISEIFAAITTPEMTQYQKVKACYDYLINSCSYGIGNEVYNRLEDYFFGDTGGVEAYCLLAENIGVCDDYSAAFVAMMRKLGFNSYVSVGWTHKASGGYTRHAWAVVKIDGVEYVFDPQIEDNISKGGKINYYRFCKTYDQVKDKYIFEAVSDKFVPFDHTPEQYLKPSIVTY